MSKGQTFQRNALQPLIVVLLCILVCIGKKAESQTQSTKGKTIICVVKVGEKVYHPSITEDGFFERVTVPSKATLHIQIILQKAPVNNELFVLVEDGGRLESNKKTASFKLDAESSCQFTFQVSDHPGLYRLTLKHGHNLNAIFFWVPENLIRKSRSKP